PLSRPLTAYCMSSAPRAGCPLSLHDALPILPGGQMVAAGLDDGRVWVCNLAAQGITPLKAEKGAAITALAMTADGKRVAWGDERSEEHTSELQSRENLVCRLLLEKKKPARMP